MSDDDVVHKRNGHARWLRIPLLTEILPREIPQHQEDDPGDCRKDHAAFLSRFQLGELFGRDAGLGLVRRGIGRVGVGHAPSLSKSEAGAL